MQYRKYSIVQSSRICRARDYEMDLLPLSPRDFCPKKLVTRRRVENNETADKIVSETIVVVPSISRFFFRNK